MRRKDNSRLLHGPKLTSELEMFERIIERGLIGTEKLSDRISSAGGEKAGEHDQHLSRVFSCSP